MVVLKFVYRNTLTLQSKVPSGNSSDCMKIFHDSGQNHEKCAKKLYNSAEKGALRFAALLMHRWDTELSSG
jgi:hypothetical protein